MAHLGWIEPQHRGRRRGRPERGRQGVGAVALGVELAETEREDEPRPDVVAERDRAQQFVAAAAGNLGGRERRRHDAAARMKAAAQMGIVGLVAVGRHAVGKGRVDGGCQDAGADHGRLGLAAEAVHIACRHFAGLEPRARHHCRDGVEGMQLGLGDDVGRHVAVEGLGHIFAERRRHRGDRLVRGGFFGFRGRLCGRRAGNLGHGRSGSYRIR